MSTGTCQILKNKCIFEGSDMGAAIFLESPSNLDRMKFSRYVIFLVMF